MQTQFLTNPALGFAVEDDYEYLLVVRPTDEVCRQVADEMAAFYAVYRHKAALQNPPHITVTRFFARQAMEETILRYMHRITSVQPGFMVMLNNYSSNPGNNIFIRVQQHEPFKQLYDALEPVNQYIQRHGYPAATRVAKPHLDVAKKLQHSVYYKAIFDYSQKTFNASFMVNQLVLLKRRSHFDAFTQVNVFKLVAND